MVGAVATEGRRHTVALTIEQALRRLDRSQSWLGAEVARIEGRDNPYSQATVSQWLDRIAEQLPARVFAIEQALESKPGTLSLQLGFLPVDARSAKTVVEAVNSDVRLDERGREALRALYDVLARG